MVQPVTAVTGWTFFVGAKRGRDSIVPDVPQMTKNQLATSTTANPAMSVR